MALTKEVVVDQILVLEDCAVQVRTATRVLEDGIVLSSSYHRHICAPDFDTTGEDAKVIAICAAVHTDAVIAAYAAAQEAANAAMGE